MTLKEFKDWYADFIANTALDMLSSNEWRSLQVVLASLKEDPVTEKKVTK
jgi:hypothetical protein